MKKLLFILFAALSFSFAAAVVDINTATAQELTTIKGIGAKTAEKIVAYREANGPFKSVDDLTKVSGIKEKRLDKIRAELTVGGAGAAKAAAAPRTFRCAGCFQAAFSRQSSLKARFASFRLLFQTSRQPESAAPYFSGCLLPIRQPENHVSAAFAI